MAGRSHSIADFCRRQKLSRGNYYALRKRGLGPREMKVGRLKRISEEAELAWQRRMEEIAEAEATASKEGAGS